MPSGTGVVDAFKSPHFSFLLPTPCSDLSHPTDLIRHGKNHNNARQYQSDHQQHPQPQQQQKQPVRDTQREPPSEHKQPVPKTVSPKYKEEVEAIVQEERVAKEKMPSYIGLENFKLLDKMGECVPSPHAP